MRNQKAVVLFAVLAVLCALTLGGCVKFKQDTVVMPDGSGKMTFRIGFNAKGVQDAASAMGRGETTDVEDPTDMDLDDLDDMQGFVAFTKPISEEKDGWKYVSFSGYFEDINKVAILDEDAGEGEEAKQVSFAFAKTESGYSLTAKSHFKDFSGMGDMGDMGDTSEVPPEMKGMMEGMKKLMESLMEGFEFGQSFTLPGALTKAEGVSSKEGRTGTYLVDSKQMKDPKVGEKLSEIKEFTLECGANEVSDAELAAFKDELAKAKAEWEKMKAEAAGEGADEPVDEPVDEPTDEPSDEGGEEGGDMGDGGGSK